MSKMDDLMGMSMVLELPLPAQREGLGLGLRDCGLDSGDPGGGKVFDEEETRAMGLWMRAS